MEDIIKPYTDKFPAILILGAPGSGKKTLGRFLGAAPTQYYLSSGMIFKSLDPDSSAGQLFFSYARKKKLVPNDVTIEIWKHYIQGLVSTNSYLPKKQDLLLDGIPRTKEQAELLKEHLFIRHIIVLESFSKDNLYERMCQRAREAGDVIEVTQEGFEFDYEVYIKEIQGILDCYPEHLISFINSEQHSLEVLRDVLVRLAHILSSRPS
ncbi:MAG: adenylate kinase [Chlamydiales bacterium]|nr:adenylate kinase [Chlamydiales bacterium]MCH9620381.1 adenylate kinase [Chlamydiales bacterium]MCH9622973.1 adenylate kinase [Chlamydiales bacterium]